ncbi:MAG: YicC family protein [Fuerstiella sp.]|nr:YicC family protein [Fuerstiella sp.]
MTGFGNSTAQTDAISVSVELRAVNNRYLKLNLRLPDALNRFENRIEKLVRSRIARGTVQLSMRVRFPRNVGGHVIDADAIQEYRQQLESLTRDTVGVKTPELTDLLALPGVVTESELLPEMVDSFWPPVEQAISESLDQFDDFRQTEGGQMQGDLNRQCQMISEQVDEIAKLAPDVVAEYRTKLLERLVRAVSDSGVTVSESDVIREVAVYADRCDINEEITRLRSHLQQFSLFLSSKTSLGRKLEFLGQEMFREMNTIGSKANNVAIAHNVVEMKAALERVREVLQNVE